jgi:hypothetical protein
MVLLLLVVAGTLFKVGEPVYIADINRFVEVLVLGTAIVEGTDWDVVGGNATTAAIGGAGFYVDTTDTAQIVATNEINFNSAWTSIGTVNGNRLDVTDNGAEGSVKVNDNTALILGSRATALTSTASGATYYDTDVASLMVFDATRTKWVSASKQLLQFGASNADGQYLTINGVQSGLTGFLMPRNAVITSITVKQAGGNDTKGFEVRVDGAALGGGTFALVGGAHSATNYNLNVAAGSFVQLFAAAAGQSAKNVVATIEIAYYK